MQQFGICEWSYPVSGPLAIRLAGEAGFDGMQLGEAGGRRMGYPLCVPRVQACIREAAAQYGVALHSLNLGALLAEGTLDHAADTEAGGWARESLRRGLAACRALDIHTVVITAEPRTEEAVKNVTEHLRFAAALGADNQVEIVMESALPLPEILRLLDGVGGNVKVCMDLLNPLRFGTGDPREQMRAFGRERISHFHMKDSIRSLFHRGERGCVLLGRGDAGYESSIEVIREMGFEGWLITENYYYLPPMNGGGGDFTALSRRDLETMRHSFRACIPAKPDGRI